MRCKIISEIGLVREENQDEARAKDYGPSILAVVCDGMGGERAGRQASVMAVREFFDHFDAGYRSCMDADEIEALMKSSVSAANSVIYTTARIDPASRGMGTTCVAAFIEPQFISVVNVGDSRAYFLENDSMEQITEDHSYVNMLYKSGKITKEQIKTHYQRNMLTKAVGIERAVVPDFFRFPHGDEFMLLLCSDGLSGYCSDTEILHIMKQKSFEEIPDALVDISMQKGGRDNITVAVVTR